MGPRLFRRGNQISGAGRFWRPGRLQWGHVFSDVEIIAEFGTFFFGRLASMGPRLFRRGNVGWIRVFDALPDLASMGPRLFRRGNEVRHRRPGLGIGQLQWGHVFSDVEIRGGGSYVHHHSQRASMGPRLFRRGNDHWRDWGDRESGASMGPRLFRRGNVKRNNRIKLFLKVASMGPRLFRRGNVISGTSMYGTTSMLQWGHVFSDVEIKNA